MDVVEAVTRAGGICAAAQLPRGRVRTALRRGELVRVRRGVVTLPDVDEHRAAATALAGVASHLSAARHWGWPVKSVAKQAQVIVPRGRKVAGWRRRNVQLRWARLSPEELRQGVTDPVRTVIDCARTLPFDEALAVADSALRSEMVTKTELLMAAGRSPRTGRSAALRVIELADKRATNPFESVLRAIVLDIAEAEFEPQRWISDIGKPDLVDVAHRVVLEADSFEFHSDAESLNHDIERYNALVCDGWTVLRFGWAHVMFDPDYVRQCVVAVLRPLGRPVRPDNRRAAA